MIFNKPIKTFQFSIISVMIISIITGFSLIIPDLLKKSYIIEINYLVPALNVKLGHSLSLNNNDLMNSLSNNKVTILKYSYNAISYSTGYIYIKAVVYNNKENIIQIMKKKAIKIYAFTSKRIKNDASILAVKNVAIKDLKQKRKEFIQYREFIDGKTKNTIPHIYLQLLNKTKQEQKDVIKRSIQLIDNNLKKLLKSTNFKTILDTKIKTITYAQDSLHIKQHGPLFKEMFFYFLIMLTGIIILYFESNNKKE